MYLRGFGEELVGPSEQSLREFAGQVFVPALLVREGVDDPVETRLFLLDPIPGDDADIKQPTIAKIDSLSTVLGIHPMTLITLCYCSRMTRDQAKQVLATIAEQVDVLFDAHAQDG